MTRHRGWLQKVGWVLSLILVQLVGTQEARCEPKEACIYYDRYSESDFVGLIHAHMLTSLVGGFRSWEARERRIQDFVPEQLDHCGAVFYIASHYFLRPPVGFYEKIVEFSQTRSVAWMNYKFDALSVVHEREAKRLGLEPLAFKVPKVLQPDAPPTPQNPDTGFFRTFEYKGETFEKIASWDPNVNRLTASPELHQIKIENPEKVQVLSEAVHSKKAGSKTPYVVTQKFSPGGAIWYVADSPFSFVHYEDRYFIFCDLLWDILGETPSPGKPKALVRLEDINPTQNQQHLKWAIDYLARNRIPFSMAIIPEYNSLYSLPTGEAGPIHEPATEFDEFKATLLYAKGLGATYANGNGAAFVMHGVTHDGGDCISGYIGQSAADYEFWKYPENTPIREDSAEFVVNRLKSGIKVLRDIGLKSRVWEVPHYAASALDYMLFGRLFEWGYHRSIYFKSDILNEVPLPRELRMFNQVTPEQDRERKAILSQIRVETDYSTFSGQVIPWPVYRDYYGQAVIPETLGMIDYPFYSDHTWRPISRPNDLLRRAKKLRVIRGAFASFFWHVDLLDSKMTYYLRNKGDYEKQGGKASLIHMIEGIRELGYEFQSIEDRSIFPDL